MNPYRPRNQTTLSAECQEPCQGAFKTLAEPQKLQPLPANLRHQRSPKTRVSFPVDQGFGAELECDSDILLTGSSRRINTWKP